MRAVLFLDRRRLPKVAFIVTTLKEHTMYPHFTPAEYARLTDAAKRQAHVLREQAISDFWRQAGIAARSTLRSASRWGRSLARHGQPGKQQGA
ncbi:MAG: hypothetical protein Q8O29_07805 [Polaromonas sp.]|uniref:hypothetical protein n=1 Tax=Polaromonas sp. TaxID=1869339 RepID=UPI0027357712|nr:hypothetical protein [Polaromonas sp.]MDP2818173.1 hypothetical protein [Polaromonas sp.]